MLLHSRARPWPAARAQPPAAAARKAAGRPAARFPLRLPPILLCLLSCGGVLRAALPAAGHPTPDATFLSDSDLSFIISGTADTVVWSPSVGRGPDDGAEPQHHPGHPHPDHWFTSVTDGRGGGRWAVLGLPASEKHAQDRVQWRVRDCNVSRDVAACGREYPGWQTVVRVEPAKADDGVGPSARRLQVPRCARALRRGTRAVFDGAAVLPAP